MIGKNTFTIFLVLLLSIVTIIFFGCAGSKQGNVDRGSFKKTFANSQDKVWGAVMGYLVENGVPIKETDRNSGTIVTDYWRDPAWTDEEIVGAECREPEGLPEYKSFNVSVQFTILVQPVGEGQNSVQVNTVFRGVLKYQSTFGESIEREIQCSSNGKLETKILENIAGRM